MFTYQTQPSSVMRYSFRSSTSIRSATSWSSFSVVPRGTRFHGMRDLSSQPK